MEITLTHKVDELRKIYQGVAQAVDNGRTVAALILATNSEEALAKFMEYLSQEHPAIDWTTKARCQVSFELVIT